MNKSIYIAILLIAYCGDLTAQEIKEFTLPNGIVISIEEAPFIPEEHEIVNCPDSKIPCKIDGLFPYGTAFSMPRTYLKKMTVSFEGKSYLLDTSGMYNAWGSRPLEYPGSIRYLGGVCNEAFCTIRGLFSDAAGSYVAEWQMNSLYVNRTILTSSSDVMSLFMKNIDPPTYQ